ncbi:CopG family ribbon-helix-helix protein [Halobaculum sp. MBLA0143]|uniref:CopG family ribbon-helix-helix protein n=1 Tax=Halobaculum sp. MBLA0143 TaxID=3079933 RepID=UPI003525A353
MPIVSTAMSEALRDALDEFVAAHGYSGRSEMIREACRSLLSEYETFDEGDGRTVATVTATFAYDTPAIERRMMDLRHEFDAAVRSCTHDCLDETSGCVETFVLETTPERLSTFVGTVRGVDESVSVAYTTLPVGDDQTADTASDKDRETSERTAYGPERRG